MTQTRIQSLIEALFNTAIGLVSSVVAGVIVFPLFGFYPSAKQNLEITVIYTVISIVRQYVLRRWFNAKLSRAANALAGRIK